MMMLRRLPGRIDDFGKRCLVAASKSARRVQNHPIKAYHAHRHPFPKRGRGDKAVLD